MIVSTANLSLGEVLKLEELGYKVEMQEEAEWANITKEEKHGDE